MDRYNALQKQINQLNKEITYLKQREKQNRKRDGELEELRDFHKKIRHFMLGLMQGQVPFEVVFDHIGHKLKEEELTKLYETAFIPSRYLRIKALTIIYHLYGIHNNIIMEFLFISRNTVKRYIRKFEEYGADSLNETRRKSIKVLEDPKIEEEILSLIHTPPKNFGYNRTAWTIKLLKLELEKRGYNVGKNNVSKIVKKAGYRFWKAKELLTSNDPKYKEKLDTIKKILSNLRPSEKFFSIDEFGPFAVKQRGGIRLVKQGEYPTVPQFQRSKGSLTLTAALELSSNQITYFYSIRKNTNEIIKMMHILIHKYSGCSTIYLSWDHASWHNSKRLFTEIDDINNEDFRKKFKTPIVKLAPLPARSQFLNVIESVFSGMAAAIIQNSDYDSVDQAKEAIDRYFKERNVYFKKNPKRAGKKIWGKELVAPIFNEGQNCKNKKWM